MAEKLQQRLNSIELNHNVIQLRCRRNNVHLLYGIIQFDFWLQKSANTTQLQLLSSTAASMNKAAVTYTSVLLFVASYERVSNFLMAHGHIRKLHSAIHVF